MELRRRKGLETDPHDGKIFAYVYTRGGEKFDAVETAFDMFEFGDAGAEEGEEMEGEREGERDEEKSADKKEPNSESKGETT